jgi:glycosyltransferase involved in cell wall biosynthesis
VGSPAPGSPPLRIGLDYTPAVRQRAGIGRYTRGLVQALAALDRQNEYVLLEVGGGEQGSRGAGEQGSKGVFNFPTNFRHRPLPLSERTMAILWHRLRLPLPVDLFTGEVDVFHSPDFLLPPLRHGRAILTVHDLSFRRRPECADAALAAYLNRAVPPSIQRADLVLADSLSTKADLVELLGVPAAKIEVLYPGVGDTYRPIHDAATLNAVRQKYNLPANFVLFVGTIEPRKNLATLLRAWAKVIADCRLQIADCEIANRKSQIGNWALVIAGGKGWLYADTFATVERLGLSGDVVFLGYVPEADLPALFSLARLFVFPSLYEGFGLPPLEAMACGTPVVCANTSSLPEVAGDAALLVDPLDADGLATAMQQALGDEGLRARLVERGLRQAARFTWRVAAQQLLAIYERVGRK